MSGLLGSGSSHFAGRYGQYGSKASSGQQNTSVVRCQKCLQLGHYTYECKNESTYKARPSRTQQLKNPKLRQGFMSSTELPPELQDKDEGLEKEGSKDKKDKKKRKRDSSPSSSSSSSDSDSSSSSSDADSSSSSSSSDSDGSSSSSGNSSSSSDSGSSGSSSDSSSSSDSEESGKRQARKKKKKQ